MTILRALTRPEYVFRPSQIWRRLRRPWSHALPEMATVIMPWGWPLQVRTQETIGRLVWTFGVFDLAVSEVLWRLAEPGDTVVDAGANVGCMSCVLAARLGSCGTVLAFEPFAQVHAELQANVESWKALEPKLAVRLFSSALGPRSGRAVLDAPGEREQNRGLAKVEAAEGGEGDIVVEALDDILGADGRVGVLKIDVEGGELGVLQGAEKLLRSRRVRDIVFEDHQEYPSPVAQFLESRGYAVYSLRRRLTGLVVRRAGEPTVALDPLDSPSFLATCDPARLTQRLGRSGWDVLRGRRPTRG